MARPRVPLISRKHVAEVALKLIDADGVEKLNMRRLGAAVGVNGASFYHHYADKDEILSDVARLVLSSVKLPDHSRLDWKDWVVEISVEYYRALLKHPNVVPLMVGHYPREIRPISEGYLVERLRAEGVPPKWRLWILQSLESFTIGSAMLGQNQVEARDAMRNTKRTASSPTLKAAVDVGSKVDQTELYALTIRTLLESLLEQSKQNPDHKTTVSRRKRSAAPSKATGPASAKASAQAPRRKNPQTT